MPTAAKPSASAARWLVVVMATVVVSFLAATAVSQWVDNRSSRDLDDIVGNAMPSVQMFALARGELRAIDRIVERVEKDQRRPPGATAAIAEARHNIDAALAIYRALPFFPGERELFEDVPSRLAALDRDLPRVGAGDDPEAIRAVDRDLDQVDRAIQRLETYDATQGQRLGLAIAHARSRSRIVEWLLNSLSVVLAVGAMLLAIRQQRGALRAVDEERAAAERQVADLSTRVDELGQFAGRVAHDLRGPLQVAMLSLEIARDGGGAPVASPNLERGAGALARMQTLIDGLLAFARAGGKPEPGASVDPRAVIAGVIDGVAGDARARGIELRTELACDTRVACSEGVLTSVASNLIRNAIRHMGDAVERRIDVRVRDAGARCRIEVQDTGPGIPPGHERRIFQPYVQLTGGKGGLGLGLATVDRLVRAHGGAVGVSAPAEGGCLFWFELPRAA